jgi:hypothetical protein
MPVVFYFVTQSINTNPEINMKEIITDSIRYWEPRRIIFNVALGGVVAASFYYSSEPMASLKPWSLLLVSAVIANAFYCAAYVADIFFQMSDFKQVWKQCRWTLLVIGTVFSAGLFFLYE